MKVVMKIDLILSSQLITRMFREKFNSLPNRKSAIKARISPAQVATTVVPPTTATTTTVQMRKMKNLSRNRMRTKR